MINLEQGEYCHWFFLRMYLFTSQWLNMYGCLWPTVCSGCSHCKAEESGDVSKLKLRCILKEIPNCFYYKITTDMIFIYNHMILNSTKNTEKFMSFAVQNKIFQINTTFNAYSFHNCILGLTWQISRQRKWSDAQNWNQAKTFLTMQNYSVGLYPSSKCISFKTTTLLELVLLPSSGDRRRTRIHITVGSCPFICHLNWCPENFTVQM